MLGPNINAAMSEDNIPRAWEALQKAQKLKANGTKKEQDYIEALSKRYAKNPPEDRTPLDQAYAEAMGKLADKYPDDLDAQTLYAEAEKIYRQDLAKFPDNGWLLYGLWQSLKDQNRINDAEKVKQKFEKAWKYADVELTASRMM